MKVSNGINVTSIYQEQLKKAQARTNSDAFGNMLTDATLQANGATDVNTPSALKHAASVNVGNPAINAPRAEEADPVEIITFAAEAVANTSDVREERVNNIKALFDAGQYNISAQAVAEKLLASGIMRDFVA